MAITSAICTSFKVDLFFGRHNFDDSGGNSFKMSLYTSSATLDATTTAYTATNEVSSGGGYTTTGQALTNVDPTSSGTTAFIDFADETWSTATITARGCLIYNDTITTPVADASVAVFDFGSDQSSTAADFTVQFPTADASNAVIRLA